MKFAIPAPDSSAAQHAAERQAQLTKPPGSLGRLEQVAQHLAGWQGQAIPEPRPAAVLLFAADHAVTRHEVSPYPSEVTRAMVDNFAAGGAAASVAARRLGLPLVVVDVGVNEADGSPGADRLESAAKSDRPVRVLRADVATDRGGDIRTEDAMSEATFQRCLEAGKRAFELLERPRVLILGEMGIGNTTAAAAVAAALLGDEPGSLVGAGTGTTGEALENKRAVVRDAVARLGAETKPLEVLRRVGGREMVALVGAAAAALEARCAVLVDGFIVSSALLALVRAEPKAARGLIYAHRSEEHGHRRVLKHLDAQPLLDLGMRLGEGSGALAAFSLVELACALHAEMATFESAGVPDREPS